MLDKTFAISGFQFPNPEPFEVLLQSSAYGRRAIHAISLGGAREIGIEDHLDGFQVMEYTPHSCLHSMRIGCHVVAKSLDAAGRRPAPHHSFISR